MRETFPDRPFRLVEVGGDTTGTSDRRSGADRRTEVRG
jgi:hypothetical protein